MAETTQVRTGNRNIVATSEPESYQAALLELARERVEAEEIRGQIDSGRMRERLGAGFDNWRHRAEGAWEKKHRRVKFLEGWLAAKDEERRVLPYDMLLALYQAVDGYLGNDLVVEDEAAWDRITEAYEEAKRSERGGNH